MQSTKFFNCQLIINKPSNQKNSSVNRMFSASQQLSLCKPYSTSSFQMSRAQPKGGPHPVFFPLVFLVTVHQRDMYQLTQHCKSAPFSLTMLTVDILTKMIQCAVSVQSQFCGSESTSTNCCQCLQLLTRRATLNRLPGGRKLNNSAFHHSYRNNILTRMNK